MTTMTTRPIAPYLKRWEEQKAQSRTQRQKEPRWCIDGDVGDELSFISAIEREAQSPQGRENGHEIFDLPPLDAFPDLEIAEETQEQQKMPMDNEFVDAATFLKENELGGTSSFSDDGNEKWEHRHAMGRPSDFFEQKSRNLEHVELSSPGSTDDIMLQYGGAEDDAGGSMLGSPQQPSSPVDPVQGVALHDHFGRDSGLSGSDTAFSSGYDVSSDHDRLMYIPRSLKHLQGKSQSKTDCEKDDVDTRDNTRIDHVSEAKAVASKHRPFLDQAFPDDPSPEYMAVLQRGPVVIKEALQEIDAVIDNPVQSASASYAKTPLGTELSEDIREFVRDYEHPLESMLPLSRTTDSWGDDTSISQVNDDVNRRGRDFDSFSSGIGSGVQITKGVRRSRSQETPELGTIREVPCSSNAITSPQSRKVSGSCHPYPSAHSSRTRNDLGLSSNDGAPEQGENNLQKRYAEENCGLDVPQDVTGDDCRSCHGPETHTASTAQDRTLEKPAGVENLFRNDMDRSKYDHVSRGSDEERASVCTGTRISHADCKRSHCNGVQDHSRTAGDPLVSSHSENAGLNAAHCRPRNNGCQLCGATRKNGEYATNNDSEPETSAAYRQSATPSRLIDALDRNELHLATDVAMAPHRSRRFLCSVGDMMTEQIIFTNETSSVGRICVSLLPLSTGCQQFSVSPAVLELGPKASSAFHITFRARYAGAVSGLFQFRGVGVDSLFDPYEIVIEASVKRQSESQVLRSSSPARRYRETGVVGDGVQEVQASSPTEHVAVTPACIRFVCVQGKNGEQVFRKGKLRLANNTAQALPFKVRALENIRVRPASGMIQPASEVIVSVVPLSQPVAPHRLEEDWVDSLTVRVGRTYTRKVGLVVDQRVIQMLPPFDKIARFRHQLSPQTDSFYYAKRGRRRGLYFHARAVELGCCNVGDSHEVPVQVCNGSEEPMTVFLQDLQEPFSCNFTTTTIKPRKYIEVMVTFTPKVAGKVATSVFAYSVDEKAVLTLVARGV